MSRSTVAFRDLVWPVIGAACGGGQLVPVESVTATDFAKQLDVLAGIDHWQTIGRAGMRGIAARVQRASMRPARRGGPLDTFTIRVRLARGGETELHKRFRALHADYIAPHLWAHAYVTDAHDALESVAVIETRVLIETAASWWLAHHGEEDLWMERDGMWVKDVAGGNQMLVIPWSLVEDLLVYRWTALKVAA